MIHNVSPYAVRLATKIGDLATAKTLTGHAVALAAAERRDAREAQERFEKQVEAERRDVREAQDQLRRTLGLKVHIEDKKGKGRVIIEYSGLEDFDSILTALGGQ